MGNVLELKSNYNGMSITFELEPAPENEELLELGVHVEDWDGRGFGILLTAEQKAKVLRYLVVTLGAEQLQGLARNVLRTLPSQERNDVLFEALGSLAGEEVQTQETGYPDGSFRVQAHTGDDWGSQHNTRKIEPEDSGEFVEADIRGEILSLVAISKAAQARLESLG